MKTLSDEALKQICKIFTYQYQEEKSCIFKDNKLYVHDSINNTDTLVATLETWNGVDGQPLWYGFSTTTGVRFLYDFLQECIIPVLKFPRLCFNKPAQYGLVIHGSGLKNITKCPFNIGDRIKMFDGDYSGIVTNIDDTYFYVESNEIAPKIPISESGAFFKLKE